MAKTEGVEKNDLKREYITEKRKIIYILLLYFCVKCYQANNKFTKKLMPKRNPVCERKAYDPERLRRRRGRNP